MIDLTPPKAATPDPLAEVERLTAINAELTAANIRLATHAVKLLEFIEEVRDFQPEVMRSENKEIPDMVGVATLYDFQADAAKLMQNGAGHPPC